MRALPRRAAQAGTTRPAAPTLAAALLSFGALLAGVGHAGPVAPAPPAESTEDEAGAGGAPWLRVEVVETYPHDPGASTQGLVLAGSRLFESTGLVNRSSLREVDLKTGRVLRRLDLPAPLFAEGLAVVGTRLFQLTWKDGAAFTYERDTFRRGPTFRYDGEGWGLCHDGRQLVMSDGSARLTFRSPEDFRATREIVVRDGGRPVDRLNELECVGPHVYANVWMTDRIVRIDGRTGTVTANVDAAGLLPAADRAAASVLNGIAWDPSTDTFLLTGKRWPKLFRVRFVPPAGSPGGPRELPRSGRITYPPAVPPERAGE